MTSDTEAASGPHTHRHTHRHTLVVLLVLHMVMIHSLAPWSEQSIYIIIGTVGGLVVGRGRIIQEHA